MSEHIQRTNLLSVAQALKILGVGRTNFYKLIKSQRIRAFKLGCRTVIPSDEIQRFIAELDPYRSASDRHHISIASAEVASASRREVKR
jgi:excisionase family DNA binding protein